MTAAVGEATQILVALEAGDRSQVDRLAQLVYEELRKVAGRHMHRERDDQASNGARPALARDQEPHISRLSSNRSMV